MTRQLLLYAEPVSVSPTRHGDLSVVSGRDYGFARELNSVPLVLSELPWAVGHFAIVFAGEGEAVMPAAVLGLTNGENAFVAADGSWKAPYVPAFLRRYPFVFSQTEDAASLALCVDEAFAGLNREGRGERLFDSGGERTGYLERILEFTRAYHVEFEQTRAVCQMIRDQGLLEDAHARIRGTGGEERVLTGFKRIRREALAALGTETLGELVRNGGLDACYAQMLSVGALSRLTEGSSAGA